MPCHCLPVWWWWCAPVDVVLVLCLPRSAVRSLHHQGRSSRLGYQRQVGSCRVALAVRLASTAAAVLARCTSLACLLRVLLLLAVVRLVSVGLHRPPVLVRCWWSRPSSSSSRWRGPVCFLKGGRASRSRRPPHHEAHYRRRRCCCCGTRGWGRPPRGVVADQRGSAAAVCVVGVGRPRAWGLVWELLVEGWRWKAQARHLVVRVAVGWTPAVARTPSPSLVHSHALLVGPGPPPHEMSPPQRRRPPPCVAPRRR